MGNPVRALDTILPLEPGDRLTRTEFEQRYEAMPYLKKAELIEGMVAMPSPVRLQRHGQPQAHLIGWLVVYESGTPGIITGDNSTVRLDLDNEPQPDALLLIDPAHGGQARVSEDDYVEMAPEFVAEVAASSASIDLHTKRQVYRQHGVREYLVWRVLERALDWFALRDGEYVRLAPDAQGVIRSEVFAGLWLHTTALLRGDMASVFATLQQGLASAEHADFVASLRPLEPPEHGARQRE
ncbi:MAG: Uma2 family endonuclease [Candidatus Tectomicrobia bacterium]|uniref:Uma2 family endonuclease n=1 Tax=Tectimicrobiota bacterium TaxID=2528274 RepID=A0A937W1G5_UNCTE|nr:Uma2 family endonuclease [Candidatus Tectomicrobia bacterium]